MGPNLTSTGPKREEDGSEKYDARVALFGRKTDLAESLLAIVRLMREVANGTIKPEKAVRAYDGELSRESYKPMPSLEDDLQITEAPLKDA